MPDFSDFSDFSDDPFKKIMNTVQKIKNVVEDSKRMNEELFRNLPSPPTRDIKKYEDMLDELAELGKDIARKTGGDPSIYDIFKLLRKR